MGNNSTTSSQPAGLANGGGGGSSDTRTTTPTGSNGTNNNNNNNLATNAIYTTNDLALGGPNSSAGTPNATLANNGTLADGGGFHAPPGHEQEFSINLFGNVLYPFRWLTIATLSSWLGPISSGAMIVGCVMPYVPQYATIHKAQSCSGFSTFVCLTLLVANILRIAFWFGHHFELPLLIQSVIMVVAQIALLELCVRVKRSSFKRTLWNSHPRFFWRWTNLASYLEFLVLFVILLGGAVYLFIDCELFIEALGYCALVSESMLGLPQVIRNFRKKSVEGMSLSMVLMWLAGDTFKTGYFISNAVPYQFWLCGLLQISIDIIILFQVCLYRQNAPMKMSTSTDNGSPKEMINL